MGYLDKIGSNFHGFWLFCCYIFDSLWRPIGYMSSFCCQTYCSHQSFFLLRLKCKTDRRRIGLPFSPLSAKVKGSVVNLKHKQFKYTKCFWCKKKRKKIQLIRQQPWTCLVLHCVLVSFKHLRYQTETWPIAYWNCVSLNLPQAEQKCWNCETGLRLVRS